MIIEQDIRGERVILSQYYEKDISKEYLSWLSDKEINRFLEVRFTEYSEALAKEYVKSCIQSPNIYFLKIVSSKGDFIGTCTITYNENHRTAEIGLMLGDKDFHNRKVTAGLYINNVGSLRAFLKNGFTIEARLGSQVLLEGESVDVYRLAFFCR
jgi:RimJ/RimL family protein N-acetyltransferase